LVSVKEYISAPVYPYSQMPRLLKRWLSFAKTGHQGFPVVSDGKMVGMVTGADLILAKHHQKIAALMTTNPVSAKPDDDIVSVAGVMAYNHIHHLPIVEGERVIGIVTATDMLRASIENITSENIERIFTFFSNAAPGCQNRTYTSGGWTSDPDSKTLRSRRAAAAGTAVRTRCGVPYCGSKKGRCYHIVDGHHRAFLARKRGMKEGIFSFS